MEGEKLEKVIEEIRKEVKKLNNLLKYIAIPVAIMAIVDIIDNIIGWFIF